MITCLHAAGERASAASDIWSFGTVLFELISQERPVRGRNRALRRADMLLLLHRQPLSLAPIPNCLLAACRTSAAGMLRSSCTGAWCALLTASAKPCRPLPLGVAVWCCLQGTALPERCLQAHKPEHAGGGASQAAHGAAVRAPPAKNESMMKWSLRAGCGAL